MSEHTTAIDRSQPRALAVLAQRINAAHLHCEKAAHQVIEHAMAAGSLLLEVKAKVPHGKWGHWIAEHCEFSDRTAQGYMRLAGRRGELESKTQRVADLPLRDGLRLLSDPRNREKPATHRTSQESALTTECHLLAMCGHPEA